MDAQIIHHHDLSSCQTGRKDLLHVDLKGDSIGGSIQDHARRHPLPGQPRDQRHVFSAVSGNASVGPLAFGRAGIQSFDSTTHAPSAHLHALRLLPVLTMLGEGRIGEGLQLRL